jgi:hypothetical protein
MNRSLVPTTSSTDLPSLSCRPLSKTLIRNSSINSNNNNSNPTIKRADEQSRFFDFNIYVDKEKRNDAISFNPASVVLHGSWVGFLRSPWPTLFIAENLLLFNLQDYMTMCGARGRQV